MKVTLIDYTGCGHPSKDRAIDLLIFTKSTRLQMEAGGIEKVAAMTIDRKYIELAYMANTIPSSWEFVDYTFCIEGVSRAFTHQFVRTRTASFAQQTMRVLDVSTGPGWDYITGPTISGEDANLDDPDMISTKDIYEAGMASADETYKALIKRGVKIEDARGILPTNIKTNIVVKMNMRTFVDMVKKRSSSRTQGEYRDVLDAMKQQVNAVHPWIGFFINRNMDRAIGDLESAIISLDINNPNPAEVKTQMIKLLDQIRKDS